MNMFDFEKVGNIFFKYGPIFDQMIPRQVVYINDWACCCYLHLMLKHFNHVKWFQYNPVAIKKE